MKTRRRLFFITLSDVEQSPYAEIALPALAADGWGLRSPRRTLGDRCYGACAPFSAAGFNWRVRARVGNRRVFFRAKSPSCVLLLGPDDVIYINSLPAGVRAAVMLAGPLGQKKRLSSTTAPTTSIRSDIRSISAEGRLCRKADLYVNNGSTGDTLPRPCTACSPAPPRLELPRQLAAPGPLSGQAKGDGRRGRGSSIRADAPTWYR